MRDSRRGVRFITWSVCALLCAPLAINARQSPAPAPRPPVPIVPAIIEYEFAAQYFRQWMEDHPQYSQITALVGEGRPPVYQIILTEKESKREVVYTNSKARVSALAAAGVEAHLTPISLRVTESAGTVPTYEFGFRNQNKQPVHWRFTPASRPSEKGTGVTQMPGTFGLRLFYRHLGTNAGEGTAVQIGDRVSEAEPWPQVSAPPHFVAYRGSLAEGMDLSVLQFGSETWHVTSSPAELREGAQWTLTGNGGRKRQLRVAERRGDELTIKVSDAAEMDSAGLDLSVRAVPQGWALRALTLTRGQHTMRITFAPELLLTADPAAAGHTEVAFQVEQGKGKKTSEGNIVVERQGGTTRLRWQPKSPEWARPVVLNSTIKVEPGGYTIEVAPAAKQPE